MVLGILALAASPVALTAQLDPSAHWRTLHTRHFLIHFTPPLETAARRLAVDAERAYADLASELAPPRGTIDVVLSDDADFTNGSATPFPSNRITLYANPPITESALRFTDDWLQMGITHELTHIFHLDRVRGIWALGQDVFGRSPVLFPNMYAPSWLTEGLAVYYETRFTGAGRIAGSEHRMIARAAAIDHAFPAINQLSLASPRFPFGEATYAYGSLFIDWLARTRGENRVRTLVDKEAADLIPVWLDLPARQAFGISFSAAWRQWSDSVVRSVASLGGVPMRGWVPLTTDAIFVNDPRWTSDSSLIYSGAPGRESYGAYRVAGGGGGRPARVGRRNSASPNVLLPDGSVLFAQLDFTSPYQERSDLYVERHGRQHRLTRGARLTSPDARADGAIVAMQIVAGGTRLVRVSRDGASIAPLTGGDMDEQWAEPRWSHRGDRIAAVRWLRGGTSQIVVLDTTGTVQAVVAAGHSVQAAPSWSPDDAGLYFTSDKTGSTEIYFSRVSPQSESAVGSRSNSAMSVLSSSGTGLFTPQLSPDGTRLAAVQFRASGFQLGDAPCCDLARAVDTVAFPATGSRSVPAIGVDSSPATSYAMWHSLVPRYWIPTVESGVTDRSLRFGAATSGSDAVGRHTYDASVAIPTDNSGLVGSASYAYAGFGLPVVGLSAFQEWEHYFNVGSRTTPRVILGEVRRRTREADLSLTWSRPRARSFMAASLGAGAERRDYAGVPAGTVQLVDATGQYRGATLPHVFASVGASNVQFPPFAISPEDGVSVGIGTTEKLASSFIGGGRPSNTVVASGSAYKSLDLPGFAHHVLALHAAVGSSDLRASGYLEAGGTSGATFELVPGVSVGQGRRSFGVRGFEANSLFGTRAVGAGAEYRVPLWMAGRGIGMLPLFFDRASLTVFGEGASAWCPTIAPYSLERQVCTVGDQQHAGHDLTARDVIASAGGELALTASLLSWDTPYRFRLGVAVPVDGRALAGAPPASVYFAVGTSF